MTGPAAVLDSADGVGLARLASAAVAARLAGQRFVEGPPSAVLQAPGASFVTLQARGRLRGCVGSLTAIRPLWMDVVRNALHAMRDPRLPAVTEADWPDLEVTVSVLSRSEPLLVNGWAALVGAVRPGVDGLLLTDGHRRATFLPAVWRKLADPEAFVAGLRAKGGWPDGAWPQRMSVSRYTTQEFDDPGPRPPLRG